MIYKNDSNKIMNFKVNKKWMTVEPEEEIELKNPHLKIPNLIKVKPLKKEPEKTEGKKKPDKLSEKELNKLTKDELNDMAAILGFGEMNIKWKKEGMVKKLLELQSK